MSHYSDSGGKESSDLNLDSRIWMLLAFSLQTPRCNVSFSKLDATLSLTYSHFWFVWVFLSHPGGWSDEDSLPGWLHLSSSVAMATPYFPTFLFLSFLSCVTLLLLVTMTPSSLPWQSPSCSIGQSWAIRLRPGPYYEDEGGEKVAVQLDVVADRVQHIWTLLVLCFCTASFYLFRWTQQGGSCSAALRAVSCTVGLVCVSQSSSLVGHWSNWLVTFS